MLKKVIYALMLMLAIFITGLLLNFKFGNLGYICLSDVYIMLFSRYFPPSYGMLIAAIPFTLCDFVLGYRQYALFTFIIKAAEGFSISFLLNKNKKFITVSATVTIIVTILLVLTDIYLYGTGILAISLKKNLIQELLVFIIADTAYYLTMKFRK